LTGSEVRGAFNIYWFLHNPDLLTAKGKADFIAAVPEETRNRVISMGREMFFKYYVPLRKQHIDRERPGP
jgi:hypothetical protein